MGSKTFAMTMMFRYGAVWLLALLGVAILGLILGHTVNLRWFFTIIMVIFVIQPGLMATFYYTHGLRRECYVNALHHQILTCEHGITARVIFYSEEEDEETGEELEIEHTKDEFFDFKEMKKIERNINSCVVILRKPMQGFIWIPESAYPNPEDFNKTVMQIADAIDKNNILSTKK